MPIIFTLNTNYSVFNFPSDEKQPCKIIGNGKTADHLPVSLLNLIHQLIGGKLPSHHHDQVLDDILSTVHIQQATYHHW